MLQDGYAVIADCFEHPGEAARAAADPLGRDPQRLDATRFVNRHCLESGTTPVALFRFRG